MGQGTTVSQVLFYSLLVTFLPLSALFDTRIIIVVVFLAYKLMVVGVVISPDLEKRLR
jgi:hypothetical protein